jgi:hypothetical protein
VFHKNVWKLFDDFEGFLLAKNESPFKYRPVGVLGETKFRLFFVLITDTPFIHKHMS